MSGWDITPKQLEAINQSQLADSNKAELQKLGGIEGLARKLGTSLDQGLRDDKADLVKRGRALGVNHMPEPDPKSWLQLFFESFEDATLIILIVSAVISLAVGFYDDPSKGWIEGAAILVAVLIVAVVTATNDYSKEQQFRQLNRVKDNINVKVIRNGVQIELSTHDLLCGDVVVLEAGDKIPADGVYIFGTDAVSNEASLTGEPEDVVKGLLSEGGDPFLLSGCQLTAGACKILVTAVGPASQWGRIKAHLATEQQDTPLQEKLDSLAQTIGYIGMFFAVLTFIATMWQWYIDKGEEDDLVEQLLDAFILSVTIVVVAVPEGLPLAVTIALAYSTKKMLKDNNLIRVLAACETMGNATNICSDKTGTLTENRMSVVDGYFAGKNLGEAKSATGLDPSVWDKLSEGISCNSTAVLSEEESGWKVVGNKTEGALLLFLQDRGIDYLQLRKERFEQAPAQRLFPFNSDRKRMSVIIQRPDSSFRLYTKGASEIVLADCTHRISATGQVLPLHASDLKLLELKIHEMAKRALRTVVVAHRDLPDFQNGELMDLEPRDVEVQLVLDAVVGIQDPLRPDVPEAVKTCQEAGVQVRMVTGDNLETACAIARDCGILVKSRGDVALEGPTFRNLTPAALDNILPKLQVIARASPHDKFLLVTRLNGQNLPKNKEEWEKMHPGANWKKDRDRLLPGYFEEWMKATKGVGQVVGVTGDGTNDAPALKAADVGLSMGLCGTEVAREASDIVLLDDKFSSIVKAVLWGRTVFDNIRKFLQFQLTVNLVALILSLIGACIGFNEPILNAVMMLWVNLIMDTMGALALGTELPSRALLCRRPYKRNANLVNRVMWRNILVQAGYQLGLLCYLLLQGHEAFGVEKGSVKHFTIIFNAFVFCQVFNEINARSIGNSMNVFKGLFSNIIFLGIIAFTVGAQYGIIQYGGDFTRTCPLTNMEWAETVLMGGLTLPLGVVMRILPPFEEGAKNFAGLGEGVHSSAVVKQDAEPSFLALLVMMVGPVLAYAVFQIFKEHGTLDIILPVM